MDFSDEKFNIDAYSKAALQKKRKLARERRERERKRALVRILFRAFVLITVIAVAVSFISRGCDRGEDDVVSTSSTESHENAGTTVSDVQKPDFLPTESPALITIGEDIVSEFAAVINADSGEVVAAKGLHNRIFPASTTKIMTALVAFENASDLTKTYTITTELVDPFYREGASLAGFSDGEPVTIRDLLYGTILPSGAEAAEALAIATVGSSARLVDLMNEKAISLGLKDTHFANVSGLHDEQNYSTIYDIAVILHAAMEVPFLKELLSTYKYTTASTPAHPAGIELTSTLFSYMYGTEPEGADILGGKTGYVDEAGYCIASFGKSDAGTEYICVTAKGQSRWPAVFDQINIYTKYAK